MLANDALTGWRESPRNRTAFRTVGEFIAAAPIASDPARVRAFAEASKRIEGSVLQQLFLKATATDAIVILSHGELAFESYENGNDARTPHIMMSASKAVTGLVAGLLDHAGTISFEAPVTAYVPEMAGTPFEGATMRDLADMRTGVVLDEAQERTYAHATGWDPVPLGETPTNLHAFLSNLRATAPSHAAPAIAHGGPFGYVSANTDLLGWALERASGDSLCTLISTLLWKPMGAECDAFMTLDREGAPRAAGGMCATARDFARIGQLFIDGGKAGDVQVVPPALLDDIANGGDRDAWTTGQWGKAFAPISKTMAYRDGWYVANDDPQIVFAMGIHGQNLFIDKQHEIVIAKFSSWGKSTDYVMLPLTHMSVGRIRKLLR